MSELEVTLLDSLMVGDRFRWKNNANSVWFEITKIDGPLRLTLRRNDGDIYAVDDYKGYNEVILVESGEQRRAEEEAAQRVITEEERVLAVERLRQLSYE